MCKFNPLVPPSPPPTAQGAAVPGGGLAAAVCGKLQRQPGHHPARRPGGAGDDGRPRPHPA